ncbi:hypothetical protein LIER_14295 [Lithospermum erythrorhizon]|uniref:Uncharacterized protein n=1 Tax=Lithospermum erythrorhizon TaxID=34254 RepID=A0AAV3Q166_LITER
MRRIFSQDGVSNTQVNPTMSADQSRRNCNFLHLQSKKEAKYYGINSRLHSNVKNRDGLTRNSSKSIKSESPTSGNRRSSSSHFFHHTYSDTEAKGKKEHPVFGIEELVVVERMDVESVVMDNFLGSNLENQSATPEIGLDDGLPTQHKSDQIRIGDDRLVQTGQGNIDLDQDPNTSDGNSGLSFSNELEATPLMDLSHCVVRETPSSGDDDDNGYWSSSDSLDVDQICSMDNKSEWYVGDEPEDEQFDQNKVLLNCSSSPGN